MHLASVIWEYQSSSSHAQAARWEDGATIIWLTLPATDKYNIMHVPHVFTQVPNTRSARNRRLLYVFLSLTRRHIDDIGVHTEPGTLKSTLPNQYPSIHIQHQHHWPFSAVMLSFRSFTIHFERKGKSYTAQRATHRFPAQRTTPQKSPAALSTISTRISTAIL